MFIIEHNDLYTHFILHIPLECARVVSGMGHPCTSGAT